MRHELPCSLAHEVTKFILGVREPGRKFTRRHLQKAQGINLSAVGNRIVPELIEAEVLHTNFLLLPYFVFLPELIQSEGYSPPPDGSKLVT